MNEKPEKQPEAHPLTLQARAAPEQKWTPRQPEAPPPSSFRHSPIDRKRCQSRQGLGAAVKKFQIEQVHASINLIFSEILSLKISWVLLTPYLVQFDVSSGYSFLHPQIVHLNMPGPA